MRVRIELDTPLVVEDHDGAVVGGVGGPVVTGYPAAAERSPTTLHLVADPKRGALVGRGSQKPAEPGPIEIEDGEQFGGVGSS